MDSGSLDRLRAALGDEDGLWPEHVPVLEAFILCETQWRVVQVTGADLTTSIRYLGLDYVGCKVALEFAGIAVTPDLWAAIGIVEAAAIAACNGVGK